LTSNSTKASYGDSGLAPPEEWWERFYGDEGGVSLDPLEDLRRLVGGHSAAGEMGGEWDDGVLI
jgi:hypothetical protein